MESFIVKLIRKAIGSEFWGFGNDFCGTVSIIGLGIYGVILFRRWRRTGKGRQE